MNAPENISSFNEDRCECRCIHEDRIDSARKGALDEGENDRLASLYKAMGDANRLKLLYALEKEEMCVCDLAVFLGITESAVSHHLQRLRLLNLVKNRRDGTVLYYRLSDDHVSELIRLSLEHIRE